MPRPPRRELDTRRLAAVGVVGSALDVRAHGPHRRVSMHRVNLADLGYGPFFADQIVESPDDRWPGRVVRMDGIRAHVWGATGQVAVDVPGKLRSARDGGAVVGDWVLVRTGPNPVMDRVLRRRTQLTRASAGLRAREQVIAANVDLVFLVMGLDGDFSPARLERYLATVADSGAEAVVLLTKAGQCGDVPTKLDRLAPVLGATPCHAIDVVDDIEADRPQMYASAGTTVAVLGSSGAGKSTLVNHLMGSDEMATASVRAHDCRGRHTTTHRQLLRTPSGAVLIDNPGMRELSLWIENAGLEQAFDDLAELAAACRFVDCSHLHEPGCAVRAAVERGEISRERVDRYVKLQQEVAVTSQRRSVHERRRAERLQGRMYRQAIAARRRGGAG
ncbi:MAG: ribosome small subunit-dependent GTPase A [Myxococcales bacterium FL481]|nr:MAG: ribosome small subunit-dependent GTPase A [Myxococcales bacterium FL481]